MILAADHSACVSRMLIWGCNAFVHEEDLKLYEAVRDTSRWNPKMKAPLEGISATIKPLYPIFITLSLQPKLIETTAHHPLQCLAFWRGLLGDM